MSESAVLFSDSIDDLIFARENSPMVIRYAADYDLLSRILEKFGAQTVFARSSCVNSEVKNLLSEKSCPIQEFSSSDELKSLLAENSPSEIPMTESGIAGTNFQNQDSELLELSPTFARLVGSSPAMQKLRNQIIRVAKFNVSVLLLGETGTGKTTVARAIHELSERRNKPFKSCVLSNSNESLIESKLFGVSKGGFTGAVEGKGLFEETDGGTLFLDEIGEISTNTQIKLLQVLSEGVINRIGSNEDIQVNSRMIFATNANLESKVKLREFRDDLFFRINDVIIRIPPLRERIEDIEELAKSILISNNIKKTISPAAISVLKTLSWRGNVRQLEKVVRNAGLIYSDSDVIEPKDIVV